MSTTINLQHIVFRTKLSKFTIPEQHKRTMLTYIYQVSKDMNVEVLRINAYKNHVHILVDLPADMSIGAYVQKIKGTSSHVFQTHPDFPEFEGWARKYGSFSKSLEHKNMILNYIRNQEDHHRYRSFREELYELFGDEFFKDENHRRDWFDE